MATALMTLRRHAWPVGFICVGVYTIWTGVVGYRLMQADVNIPRWVEPPLYDQIVFGCVWLAGGTIQLVRSLRGARSGTSALQRRCGLIAVGLAASIACSSRVSRVLQYGVGTSLDVIVATVGPPDRDERVTDAVRRGCPAEATRIVVYRRQPLVPWVDEGAVAILCVDPSERVFAFSSSLPW